MSAPRKPLSFDIDRGPAAAAERAGGKAPQAPAEERKQIGARISVATYRKLKAHAAMTGRTVGELVERAVENFLESGA